ncbi:MAG: succinyl-diaminopimelate desuccinylase [Magnetococcales bacterium]|nr:succinyl-diaminopimelate desuccinylase [Magnetococcales bacterium]
MPKLAPKPALTNCSVSSKSEQGAVSPLIALAQALIKTPSITPKDLGCQEIIIKRLAALGFVIHPLRFGVVENFYARLGSRGKNFCFAGHTDVVAPGDSAGWRSEPFAAQIVDGQLWGRGACDMKGAIAAMVVAFEEFLAANPGFAQENSLSFLITGDEEGDAVDGTVRVLQWLEERGETLDYCLVGEPTSVKKLGDCLKNGRRGSINGVITFKGKQGHVAYPHLADNPIHSSAPVLAKLATVQFDQGNEHFPASSIQFTNISSGDGSSNVVPPTLEAQFNIRFSPENSPESLEEKIRSVLDEPGCPEYSLTMNLSGLPFLSQDGELRTALDKSINESLNLNPQGSTGGGTSDARFISQVCPQTMEFGLVGSSMHKLNEGVPLADLEELCEVYKRLLINVF